MRRIIAAFAITLLTVPVIAQPPARRQAQQQAQQAQQKKADVGLSERARMEFPTAPEMADNVVWRRDLYRKLDLGKDKNAVLYYPAEPTGDRMNLFTYLFKLVMRRQVNAYEYTLDGNENFATGNVMKLEDLLFNHHIAYEEKDGRFRVLDADIPSAAVKAYYIKESTYFDQNTSQFRSRVTAICPVRYEPGLYDGESDPYPMFWLKYDDIAPYLNKLSLMASNYNNAATISADDFFSTARYDGTIYKTNNLQGKVFAHGDSAAASQAEQEQKRIERELAAFESQIWGTDSVGQKRMQARIDSTTAARNSAAAESKKEKASASQQGSTSSRSQVKRQKESGATRSSAPKQPRVTVRRQRH